jgi:hypothetical protein
VGHYDRAFASRRQRRTIPAHTRRLSCALCLHQHLDTASQYEWPCLLLDDWICETHCTEATMRDYPDCRAAVRLVASVHGTDEQMLAVCRSCPYSGT